MNQDVSLSFYWFLATPTDPRYTCYTDSYKLLISDDESLVINQSKNTVSSKVLI